MGVGRPSILNRVGKCLSVDPQASEEASCDLGALPWHTDGWLSAVN